MRYPCKVPLQSSSSPGSCATLRAGWYRGTSLIRIRNLLGPYRRTMSRALLWSWGMDFSYERGTPVGRQVGWTRKREEWSSVGMRGASGVLSGYEPWPLMAWQVDRPEWTSLNARLPPRGPVRLAQISFRNKTESCLYLNASNAEDRGGHAFSGVKLA